MKIYRVGGSVRDELLGREPKDKDYVVVGSSIEEMLLRGFKQVGKDFPVFLHPETGDEYALARKEIKTGDKHTDFEFYFGPDVTLEMDLRRRDFTMNAIAKDEETGELIDPFHGYQDIQNKIIRHVDETHFIEDPLRVLRGLQFSTRFKMEIHRDTLNLFRRMVKEGMLLHLTEERIWNEIEKALYTTNFYNFITLLQEIDALEQIFPEVYDLINVPERLEYHPEGNAYDHTILALKEIYKQFDIFGVGMTLREEQELALTNFGLLCHDLGKAKTNKEEWPAHHEHETLGIPIIKNLCKRLKVPNEFRDYAILACKYHMKMYNILNSRTKTIYDFVNDICKFKNYDKLCYMFTIHECDLMGRKGEIAHKRIENMHKTIEYLDRIFNIMNGVTLKNLPEDTQKNLSRFKGVQFGKLYRDAMISYLKHSLYMGKLNT